MEEDKYYKSIQKALENLPGNFNILEEKIDIDIQMEYFEMAKKERGKITDVTVEEGNEELFSENVDTERKKEILLNLAIVNEVTAYRTIEKFVNASDGYLKYWAILSLQENRMLLQSTLLDEQQIFISTGLGGKGQKLRYFIVFINSERTSFLNETQRKLLKDELIFELKRHDGEFELIDFMEGFSTSQVMLPLKTDIKSIFRNIILECNQYGNFLQEDMVVTNVKILSKGEIIQLLDNRENNNELEKE